MVRITLLAAGFVIGEYRHTECCAAQSVEIDQSFVCSASMHTATALCCQSMCCTAADAHMLASSSCIYTLLKASALGLHEVNALLTLCLDLQARLVQVCVRLPSRQALTSKAGQRSLTARAPEHALPGLLLLRYVQTFNT